MVSQNLPNYFFHFTLFYTFRVFPSLFYITQYNAYPSGPSVDIVFIDTIVLCGNTWDDEADEIGQNGKKGKPIKHYKSPANPALAEAKWAWIKEQLAKST